MLWRKLFPSEREAADGNLISITYDLIVNRNYELACALLDFACETLKTYADEWHKLVFVVNRAQAYKWAGNDDHSKEIMSEVDWSAKGEEFKLAAAVLAEEWEKAAQVMRLLARMDL